MAPIFWASSRPTTQQRPASRCKWRSSTSISTARNSPRALDQRAWRCSFSPAWRVSAMPLYSLNGRRPTLPPEGFFWIAPNASVIGDVVVGLDVGIWFGAVLRGDNEQINIGARTNIQESCTLHTDMGSPLAIGEECTIGHNVILHGCAIGEGSLIGMGAIVLNGARIGRGCLVGAGALVTEGKTFDDHSLIMGSPAKAIRTLDKEALAKLRHSAAHYVDKWRQYAVGMKPIDLGE